MGMLKIMLFVLVFGFIIALSSAEACYSDSECPSNYKCCTGTTWCCQYGYICTGTSTCLSVGVIVGPVIVIVVAIIACIAAAIFCLRRKRQTAGVVYIHQGVTPQGGTPKF
ncbi:uncharacterized protein LOC133174667 [Saccostrea echinata]|uniref:uncharacterized protein LOC133174667 n=1 Tax=Saccostrea echinata TaxID=191078 RepID=UPI002A7FD142|nr:uncharacterized protein LOC133174667 [Saccostrea echinata]